MANGTTAGAFNTAAASGGLLASQIDYTLVPGTGDDDNNSFQIVNGELETAAPLTPGTYTAASAVPARSSLSRASSTSPA